MINYKNEIAKYIQDTLDTKINELESFIEIPPNTEMGDYSFPCFKLAKELKKSPIVIAEDINRKIKLNKKIISCSI